jgi:hypothetical protein
MKTPLKNVKIQNVWDGLNGSFVNGSYMPIKKITPKKKNGIKVLVLQLQVGCDFFLIKRSMMLILTDFGIWASIQFVVAGVIWFNQKKRP